MSEIREDQKAKISFFMPNNTEMELDCVIKDIHKDRISLTFPKEALSYANYLQEGNEIPVKIFTPSGIRMFDAIILNSPLEQEFVIEYVENSIQIQRREYSRCALKTKIIIERKNEPNVVTQTIDIGGGGVRFVYEGYFYPEERVSCRLYLPLQMASIVAEGYLVEKPHLQKNERILLFDKISEFDRDRIIKKCFELEANNYK